MRRSAAFALMLAAATLVLIRPAAAQGMLRLASDDWCPFVCARDGKLNDGFLIDAAAQAMASQGYQVVPVLMPLSRAIVEAGSGNIEGVYAPPLDARLRDSVPITWSRACFYTRNDSSWTFQGMHSLQGVKLGVIGDYGYDGGEMDAYVERFHADPKALDFSHGATAGTTNLQKLLGGRYPVMLEHEAVVGYLARLVKAEGQLRKAGCLARALPLTIGFSQEDGRTGTWMHALSDGLKKLEAAGTLEKLRQQYGIPATPARSLHSGG
jgi:polar amino acid transport system substrate-binding protein